VAARVNDYLNGYIHNLKPLDKPSWLDTALDIYIPIVFNGKLIRDARTRSFENQNMRLELMPSFEDELVLDIGCNTGFITYHIAKTAKRVIGIDNNESTLYIPKSILNNPHNEIRNIEFHNTPLEWVATRPWARKYFDTVVYLSVMGIDKIEKIMPRLALMAKHRVILEPTNKEKRTPEQVRDYCNKVLGQYGRVEFLGNTDYQGRGMFAVYLR
jgi:SAM-dependent methyltransferase